MGIGADLETEFLAGARDRLGDRAHAATHEAPAAGARVLAHDVVHDDIGGARRLRAREGADAGVIGQHRLHHVALKPAREVIIGAHGEEIDQPIELIADLAVFPEELGVLAERAPVALGRIDRRLQQHLAHDVGGFGDVAVEGRVDLGVVF